MRYGKIDDELESMGFSLTRGIAAYLRERAGREDRSISSIVRRIILEAMAADPSYELPEAETEVQP